MAFVTPLTTLPSSVSRRNTCNRHARTHSAIRRAARMTATPATAPKLVLNMMDDTRISFTLGKDALKELMEELDHLIVVFKEAQAAKAKGERAVRVDAMEFMHEEEGLRFSVDCNPNLFENAFSATAYVMVDDGRVRVSSTAQLTRMIDNVKTYDDALDSE